MAKMFYTVAETAAKLGMSESEVKDLAASGQLEEFRDDNDNLVFKVSQVDLLSGGGADTGAPIALADSGELDPLGLESSGSQYAVDAREASDPKERTGISIFDTDETEHADPSAQTQVTSGAIAPEFNMDSAASGSGLYDLGGSGLGGGLGGDLLEDVYGAEETGSTAGVGMSAGDTGIADPNVALFETSTRETETGPSAVAIAAAEPYDGPWSGIAGGLALGAIVALLIAAGVAILGLANSGVGHILAPLGTNALYVLGGAGLVVALLGAIIGWLLLRNA